MIAYLEGEIREIWDNCCILLTDAGVGYELSLPGHTCAQLPGKGERAAFYTSLAIREDAWDIYAFSTFEERQTFKILTSISKIGAKTALAILSLYRPAELRELVINADVEALTRVPGIGRKTAQHMLFELEYKLKTFGQAPVAPGVMPASSTLFRDTLAALLNLGYAEDECSSKIRDILKEEPDLDVSSAIRLTLKAMARGKA